MYKTSRIKRVLSFISACIMVASFLVGSHPGTTLAARTPAIDPLLFCEHNDIIYTGCGEDACTPSGTGATSSSSGDKTSKDDKTIQEVIDEAVAEAKSKGVNLSVVVSGDVSASGGAGGQMPSASIIKLLIAATLADKNVPLSSVIGELNPMISVSSNEAANSLIKKAGGFAAINATAAKLGVDASIGRELGVSFSGNDPNRMSAKGSDTLLNIIKQSEGGGGRIKQDYAQAIMSAMRAQTINTKWGSSGIPLDKMAHKTGELPSVAQHDVGYFFNGDKWLAVSTLSTGSNDSTSIAIIKDTAKKIYDAWLGNKSEDESPSGSGSSGSLCCSPSSGSSAASAVSASGSGAPGLSAEQVAFLEQYHDIAEKLSVQYGIPWETVMAQGMVESGSGTSNFARERNNFFGIGAFDSNPNNAHSFATPEEGWEGYYKNIVNTQTYRDHGVFSGNTVTDPYAYLRAVKDAGYATDPDYVSKNSKVIDAINNYAKTKGWASSAELAAKHPEMLENAETNAQGATANQDSSTSGSTSGAACSSTAPSGSIAEVANQMGEWGAAFNACYAFGGGHGKDTAWLDEAIANHFTGDFAVDCSAFVRAVIYKATGEDPGDMNTSSMCADSSKFEKIDRSMAQPGDLAIDCANHVEVITGVNDGKFTTVGSHKTGCGAGYGASPGSYQGTESFVLRYKG